MRVLVVGSGAREHAIVRAIRRSPGHATVYCTPGNSGIATDAPCFDIRADDVDGIEALNARERFDLVVIGPEAPLVAGLADRLRSAGTAVFGPGASGARLEGSKAFSKDFMRRNGVPTADYAVFDDADDADRYIRDANRSLVVKADGLAAGKGVVVAADAHEALDAVDAFMRQRVHGAAGARVVVEELLPGAEISLHVLVADGAFAVLGAAQDHKRIGDGDTGPNTGGMGAYTPVPWFDDALLERTVREIVAPTVGGLTREGIAFRGVLFVGLMVQDGVARVLEYNVRFGDPETSVLLAVRTDDVAAWLGAVANGDVSSVQRTGARGAACAVVVAAPGYPQSPRTGSVIHGLGTALPDDVAVLHAGTRRQGDRIVTSGGRVLAVVGTAPTSPQAIARAYDAVRTVDFDGAQYRRDIGWQVVGR